MAKPAAVAMMVFVVICAPCYLIVRKFARYFRVTRSRQCSCPTAANVGCLGLPAQRPLGNFVLTHCDLGRRLRVSACAVTVLQS